MHVDLISEFRRKILHLFGIVPILIYLYIFNIYSADLAMVFLFSCFFISLLTDYLRVDYGLNLFIPVRSKEKNNFHASTFFFLASIIVFSFFDQNIALNSLLLVIFGDFFSATFGKAFGFKKIFRNKSYVGSFTGFVACLIVGFFILNNIFVIFSMALIYFLVDLATHNLDDNLVIPIFASVIGSLASVI